MEATTPRQRAARSSGLFVTPSGSRVPVRELSNIDVPALVEFSDYLSRETERPHVVGYDRNALEDLVAFEPGAMLGIMVGPRLLIRGVASYKRTTKGAADVHFTVDDSVLADGLFLELVYRIADSARDHEITQLHTDADASDHERAALQASGFPVLATSKTGDGVVLDITEPR